jgi:acetyl-CoA carboxylase alpha subunit
LNWDEAAAILKMALQRNLKAIRSLGPDERLAARFEKFRSVGNVLE